MNSGRLETSLPVCSLPLKTPSHLADSLIVLKDMENAYISDLFRAPIHSHDAQVQRDMLSSPTIAETLLFWMAACMGIGGINWVPFDDKATS